MAKHLATWCDSVWRDSVLTFTFRAKKALKTDVNRHPLAAWELFGGPKLVARILNGQAASLRQPFLPLVALAAIFAAGLSVFAARGVAASRSTELLWSFEFQLILALWVLADRRNRGFSVPYEFDTFVFFAWPAVVPYYLYRSRGRGGLFLGAGICGPVHRTVFDGVACPDSAERLAFELRPLHVTVHLRQWVEAPFCSESHPKERGGLLLL